MRQTVTMISQLHNRQYFRIFQVFNHFGSIYMEYRTPFFQKFIWKLMVTEACTLIHLLDKNTVHKIVTIMLHI